MASPSVKWNGREFLMLLRADTTAKLHKIGYTVVNHIKRYTGRRVVSDPGEYPGMRTGRFRGSVRHEVNEEKKTVRIGTNVKYGMWLELGTKKMAKRPWLVRAWRAEQPKIRQILAERADTKGKSSSSVATEATNYGGSESQAEGSSREGSFDTSARGLSISGRKSGGGGGGGGGAAGGKKKKKKHKR